MAKAKSRSSKSKSSGGWRKRLGARPGLGQDPFLLGLLTWHPSPLNGQPWSRIGAHAASQGPKDFGFYGRPKSSSRPLGFNKAREYTGGMHFEEAETVVLSGGRYHTLAVQHDEHREAASEERKAERKARSLARAKAERAAALDLLARMRSGTDTLTAREQQKRVERIADGKDGALPEVWRY